MNIELYNMILEKNWLAKHNIWLDTENTHLIWLDEQFLKNVVQKMTIKTLSHCIMQWPASDPAHQADAN